MSGRKPLMPGQWSMKHGCCKECGTTDRKHGGFGLCRNCYMRFHEHAPYLPPCKWSRVWSRCRECCTTTVAHKARGRCVRCDDRRRYREDEVYRGKVKARSVIESRRRRALMKLMRSGLRL